MCEYHEADRRLAMAVERKSGIVADFLLGMSVLRLMRKYRRTRAQIETALRQAM